MKKFPYVVKIKGSGRDINITVRPKPVATKEQYIKAISSRINGIILKYGKKSNSFMTRMHIKKELTDALMDFHKKHMIKPLEK